MKPIIAIVALSLGAISAATEVVIQNDTLQQGGQGYVQAGFVAGEAGAAWLTSNYTGTIVAVQILWQSLDGTGGSSIQDSITVYAAGTFPHPGDTLAILPAPQLTDGFLNEFRYLDENQTIPLSVPVTAGQSFVVALRFAETPPMSGPSLVTDLGACQTPKNAIDAQGLGWTDPCILGMHGNFVIRAVVDTAALNGACCMPDGTCTSRTSAQCASGGGVFQGTGTSCANVQCPQPAGACCIDATHGCLNLTQANCAVVGGRWGGFGTSCATYVCFPIGACCLPDGTCVGNLSPALCAAQNGTFQGNATQCGGVSCPPPTGACCVNGGNCLVLTQADCGVVAGAWAGPFTNCADTNSNGHPDICETPRPGDMNCDGHIDFNDINPFVLALADPIGYHRAYPTCPLLNGDCNADGLVDFNDINDFVRLLVGG